jgi:hypothetical protein
MLIVPNHNENCGARIPRNAIKRDKAEINFVPYLAMNTLTAKKMPWKTIEKIRSVNFRGSLINRWPFVGQRRILHPDTKIFSCFLAFPANTSVYTVSQCNCVFGAGLYATTTVPAFITVKHTWRLTFFKIR